MGFFWCPLIQVLNKSWLCALRAQKINRDIRHETIKTFGSFSKVIHLLFFALTNDKVSFRLWNIHLFMRCNYIQSEWLSCILITFYWAFTVNQKSFWVSYIYMNVYIYIYTHGDIYVSPCIHIYLNVYIYILIYFIPIPSQFLKQTFLSLQIGVKMRLLYVSKATS